MSDTNLTLSGIGIVPFSARDISESLSAIDGGSLRRTINGTLTDLTLTAFQKFRVTISGQDIQPPAFDGVWRGKEVTVGCVSELGKQLTLTSGVGSVAIGRKPVTGSGRAIHVSGSTMKTTTSVVFSQDTSGNWSAAVTFSDTGLAGTANVFFRPELICLVTDTNLDTDEWAASPGWTLTLEEK